jgi:hypothetical protein
MGACPKGHKHAQINCRASPRIGFHDRFGLGPGEVAIGFRL